MSSLVLLPLRNLHFLKVNFSMNVTPKGQNVHQLLSFTSSLNVSKIKVRTGPGILLWHFPGLESPGKRPLVLGSSGNLLNSAEKYEVYGTE